MEVDVIYNRYGYPELRLLNNGRLVSFDGTHIGFLVNSNVYNYEGTHVGWYENGILRDHYGQVVGFGQNPHDFMQPLLPLRALKPIPSLVMLAPLLPLRQLPPIKPLKSFNWSEYDPINLFSLQYG